MPDNGYGAEDNSKDFLLRMYRIRPSWRTARGGRGTIAVERFINLRDPDGHVPFALERADRRLTGGDFDPESVRRDAHGDLWFGDEFGPWLLHTNARGKLLEPPIALPGVTSPQNPPVAPFNPAPTLPRSSGFEGMALGADGETLYPMLEGALLADPDQRRRLIHRYVPDRGGYTGRTWQYRVEAPGHAIGDLTQLDRHRFVVIERDNLQGTAAAFKKIYVIDRREVDAEGFLVKREVVDLLHIDPGGVELDARPGDIGLGAEFAFPFQTIEDVLPLGRRRLLVICDNNLPFSNGRNPAEADRTEAIVLDVPGLRR
jgi:glycerophosphoryl diester phosphodiesterase